MVELAPALVRSLRAVAGHRRPSPRRASGWRKGIVHGPAVKAEAPAIDTRMPAAELFRQVLGACLRQILPNASEIAAGSDDAEHIHQLRVGIRRLRTALREMADFAEHVGPGWEPVLVEAFQALGRQRDREHVQQMVQPAAAGAWRAGFRLP